MAFRRVERGVGSDKWGARIISGWMLSGYKIAREWRIWWRWVARREKQCIFGGGVLRILNGSCGTRIFRPRIARICTDAIRVAFIKKHETRRSPTDRMGGNFTDEHGWVFSRIIYSCSASCCLVFDAPSAQRIATDISHAERGL